MKFKEYIKQLKEFLQENPEAANLDVIYAKDAEGNGFDNVHYGPTIGNFEDGDFSEEPLDNDPSFNAVCIN